MAFFQDEAVRESMQPAGGAVFNLLGAVDGRQPFSSAKRRDGTPVQSGDKTCVAVVQKVGGVTYRAVSVATLTLGGSNFLTLDTTAWPAGKMYFSTAGASFPGFNTADVGEVFITTAVPLLAQFDDQGALIDPLNFRRTLAPSTIAAFLAEIGVADNEAVVALGRSGAAYNGLGGLFAQNNASTGTVDNVDKHANPNTGQGRVDRVPIKVAPTFRGNVIGAGGVVALQAIWAPFNLADPTAEYFVHAWREGQPSTQVAGYFIGHASAPVPYNCSESADAGLRFDIAGTELRLLNAALSSINVSVVIERIG